MDIIQVFESMDAVLERLKITAHLEHFDLCETYKIECHEITTLEKQKEITQRVVNNKNSG